MYLHGCRTRVVNQTGANDVWDMASRTVLHFPTCYLRAAVNSNKKLLFFSANLFSERVIQFRCFQCSCKNPTSGRKNERKNKAIWPSKHRPTKLCLMVVITKELILTLVCVLFAMTDKEEQMTATMRMRRNLAMMPKHLMTITPKISFDTEQGCLSEWKPQPRFFVLQYFFEGWAVWLSLPLQNRKNSSTRLHRRDKNILASLSATKRPLWRHQWQQKMTPSVNNDDNDKDDVIVTHLGHFTFSRAAKNTTHFSLYLIRRRSVFKSVILPTSNSSRFKSMAAFIHVCSVPLEASMPRWRSCVLNFIQKSVSTIQCFRNGQRIALVVLKFMGFFGQVGWKL